MTYLIAALDCAHAGHTVNIIGKGPSLAHLRPEHFPYPFDPIICLNQAILPVLALGLPNPVYSQQKDGCRERPCRGRKPYCVATSVRPHDMTPLPDGVPLIVHEAESRDCFPEHEPRYIFSAERDFGVAWNTVSACIATLIAKRMGAVVVRYVCCDGPAGKDERVYAPDEHGTWRSQESPTGYSYLRAGMYAAAEGMFVEWVTPEEET